MARSASTDECKTKVRDFGYNFVDSKQETHKTKKEMKTKTKKNTRRTGSSSIGGGACR